LCAGLSLDLLEPSALLLGYGIGQAINGNLADIDRTTAAFYVIGGVCIVGALVILPVRE